MKLVGWFILALICLHSGHGALVILLIGALIGVAVTGRR